jgi:hypothetical protein
MPTYAERTFGHAELGRHLGVGSGLLVPPDAVFEFLEQEDLVSGTVFITKTGQYPVHQSKRPASLVELVRGQVVHGFGGIAAFGAVDIQREETVAVGAFGT